VAKIQLGVVPAVMKYDHTLLTVKPGEKVMLLFQNAKCPLQHNLVLVKPGKLADVGALADAMLRDPAAITKNYIPTSPDIIASSSKLLGIGQSDLIQFTAPTEPGDYPYLCTFPGHWRLMNGILRVAP
jgi:azurin